MTDCDGLITNLRNANNAAGGVLDLDAIKAAEIKAGLDWTLKNAHPLLMAIGPLVAEVERLREREATLIRVKDADLDDARDESDYLKAEVERLRKIVAVLLIGAS